MPNDEVELFVAVMSVAFLSLSSFSCIVVIISEAIRCLSKPLRLFVVNVHLHFYIFINKHRIIVSSFLEDSENHKTFNK